MKRGLQEKGKAKVVKATDAPKPRKEWKNYTRKEKRDVYAVFATAVVFILSWIATDFISAIVMVLFGYFVYYIVNIFRRKQYRKNNTIGAAVFFVLLAISAPFVPAQGQHASTEPSSSQVKAQETSKKAEQEHLREIEAAKPVVKHETKTEPVPFESTEQNDNTIPAGEKRLSVAGVVGERTIMYDVTYVKGKETARTVTKNEITKAPVTQVTLNGTYVKPAPTPAPKSAPSCPNGTYVNSAGNTVCRPYQSSGTPAGATAQCSDGTYSFSQSRRGTCSGHGGVAQWL